MNPELSDAPRQLRRNNELVAQLILKVTELEKCVLSIRLANAEIEKDHSELIRRIELLVGPSDADIPEDIKNKENITYIG